MSGKQTYEELEKRVKELEKELQDFHDSDTFVNQKIIQFETIVNSISDAVIVGNTQRQVAAINPAFTKLWGYSIEELKGKTTEMLYENMDDYEEQGRNRYRVDGTVEHQIFEVNYRRKNGTVFHAETLGTQILDNQGNVIGYVGIHRDITDRKRSEEALIQSEAFLKATGQIAKVGGWQIDGKTDKVFWTEEIYNITEAPPDCDPSSLEKEGIVFFTKEDRLRLEKAKKRALEHAEPYNMEFLITTAKGNKKWVQAICEPVVVHGKVVKLGGTFQDITERKQAEEALKKSQQKLRQFTNKLIVAQEAEYWQLARELHDDITQRIAVLSIEAGKIEQQLHTAPDGFLDSFKRMQDELVNLSSDIHAISRRLHPSILEDLGLSDAIKSESEAIIKREGIVINYAAGIIPPDLPKDVALCFYRILQEGLRNVTKHARATEVNVYLSCHKNQIHLFIEDDGQGFDLNEVDKKPGLGLASMEERTLIISGNFNIRSHLGEGTRIKVTAPIKQVSL
ncbi:MAG: PAS domain S-box protein [Deltaproteobacteria bacterium]|nr:PAS domain S-box protein [Deltaproteobacteria bacterium]